MTAVKYFWLISFYFSLQFLLFVSGWHESNFFFGLTKDIYALSVYRLGN